MIETEASTIIDAQPEKVWEYISDSGKWTEWDPDTLKVEWQPRVTMGSVAIVTAQAFGGVVKSQVFVEITEWQSGQRMGVRFKSVGTTVKAVYNVESAEGNGTKVSRCASVEVGGLLRLISPLVARKTKNERSIEIENIKRIFEGQQKKPTQKMAQMMSPKPM